MSAVEPPQLYSDLLAVWRARARYGDAPCWSERQQALYWVDTPAQRLYRYTPDNGHRERWYFQAPVYALAERQDADSLLVALPHGLACFDPQAADGYGRLEPLAGTPSVLQDGQRWVQGGCDSHGRFWIGLAQAGRPARGLALWQMPAHRDRSPALQGEDTPVHGLAWSPDGATVYLNDGDSRVWAFDFDAGSAQLSARRECLRCDPAEGRPRGMAVDTAGRLWIARWGGGCVSCHDPADGRELMRLELPARQVTHLAFGGPHRRTLFVCSAREGMDPLQLRAEPLAGALFSVQTDATGLPAGRYAG